MRIVGVVGAKRSGKDTLAGFLTQHFHGGPTKTKAFADELKLEIAAAFGLKDLSLFTQDELKEVPTQQLALKYCRNSVFIGKMLGEYIKSLAVSNTPRRIMQLWGTDFRRAQNPGYWVDKVHRHTLESLKGGAKLFVFTDVRFLTEANYIRSMGGALVRVRRAGTEPTVDSHVSEWEQLLIPCKEVIENGSTLLALEEQAALFVSSMTAEHR